MQATNGPTWHYGLVARWWAETVTAEPEELAYYRGAIERYGQPALDVACGTGRLLLPLVASGLDVDGVDVSEDMLAHCRARAAEDGLSPRLWAQAIHELELPRRYGTVFVCDSFGIGGNRDDDLEGLRRIHNHLEPGGTLVFSHDLPFRDPAEWELFRPETRRALPQEWPPTGDRRRLSDGDELTLRSRIVAFEPGTQRLVRQMSARLWRGEGMVAEEERQIAISLYFEQELRLMLEAAGFGRIEIQGRYTAKPAGPDDTTVVFVVQRD